MSDVLYRIIAVWILLNIILFFVEIWRYKHSNWSWYGFKTEGMLDITCIVWALDKLGGMFAILSGLVYWIL